jgi:hypothetical protein
MYTDDLHLMLRLFNCSTMQKVPALQLGEDTVIESLVINEFLADRFSAADGGSALMPGIYLQHLCTHGSLIAAYIRL